MNQQQASSEGLDRRQFLGGVIKAIGGLVTAAVGLPIIGYILSPLLTTQKPRWHEVGLAADFRPGQPILTIFPITVKDGWVEKERHISIYVRRDNEAQFTVFSPKCTHLGCMVQWNDNARQFFCPCHAAVFDREGINIAGPAPRPLDRYEVKVENGRLYVGALQPSA